MLIKPAIRLTEIKPCQSLGCIVSWIHEITGLLKEKSAWGFYGNLT